MVTIPSALSSSNDATMRFKSAVSGAFADGLAADFFGLLVVALAGGFFAAARALAGFLGLGDFFAAAVLRVRGVSPILEAYLARIPAPSQGRPAAPTAAWWRFGDCACRPARSPL